MFYRGQVKESFQYFENKIEQILATEVSGAEEEDCIS